MSSTSAQAVAITYIPLSFPPITDAQGRAGFPANANVEHTGRGDGPYKHYELLGSGHPRHLMWREKVGQFIAKEVMGRSAPPGHKYIMSSFPDGYELYAYVSRNAKGLVRQDIYLFGQHLAIEIQRHASIAILQYYIGPSNSSKLYKFTSPADFAPHAKWIYDNQTSSACFCRTCGGKRCQALRRLSPPIDLIKSRSPSPSASSITSTETFQGDVPPKSYREGEVVWVSLTPLAEYKPLEESIAFWPAVVADVEVELGHEKGRRVVGFNVYTLCLLGTTVTERAYDIDVIPYLGYCPSIELNGLAAKYEALPPSAIQALIDGWKNGADSAESAGLKRVDGRGPRRPITLESIMPWYLAAVHACENIALCYSVDYPCRLGESHKDQANQYYQGIWWGCERIWMFDLVRLKAERCQFPDEVQSCFLPVSEHSPTTRGLFLYINAIYEPKGDSCGAITSLTGTLYEITAIAEDNAGGASESAPLRSACNRATDTGETLPPAPAHFSWKSVLDSNDCVTIPASLIAGRYYPEIHLHPRLGSPPVPEMPQDGDNLDHAETLSQFPAILSLAGLERGWHCQTKSNRRTKVRCNAMQQASAAAESRAQEWINNLLPKSNPVL